MEDVASEANWKELGDRPEWGLVVIHFKLGGHYYSLLPPQSIMGQFFRPGCVILCSLEQAESLFADNQSFFAFVVLSMGSHDPFLRDLTVTNPCIGPIAFLCNTRALRRINSR